MQQKYRKGAPSISRTDSASSAVSHMDLQIKHHWNDAVVASSLKTRSISPLPPVTDEQIQEVIQRIIDAPSKLSEVQHKLHVEKVRSQLKLRDLSQDAKFDLDGALRQVSPDQRRKAIVTFIREHDGVIRWAASLRALTESEDITGTA